MSDTPARTPRRVASKFSFGYWWARAGIFLVLILLVFLMSIIAPRFATIDNVLNVARSTSINAILAAGVTLVILTAGIDLSVGSLLAVSGVVGVFAWSVGVPSALAVLIAIGVGAAAGLLNGVLTAWVGLPAFIVTLGALTYLRGTAYALTDGEPLTATGLGFRGLGNGTIVGLPSPVAVTIVLYFILWVLLERMSFGRYVYAVGNNMEAARLAGIKVRGVITAVFVISGAAAGLGGAIYAARVESGQPTSGEGYELDAIAAVVLGGTSLYGGRGRILGTLVGALIIGVLTNGLVLMNVPFFYQNIVKGAVIVLAVGLDSLRRLQLK